MVQTKKLYRCKIFYKVIENGVEKIKVKNELSNMFIMNRLSLKCFCDIKAGAKYYNIVSVNIGGRWINPIKFVGYLFAEGKAV